MKKQRSTTMILFPRLLNTLCVLICVSICILSFASCKREKQGQSSASNGGAEYTQSKISESTNSFTDDDGNAQVFGTPAKRIISLYGAHTENLFTLGAGDLVVGVQKRAKYPAAVKELPQFDYNGDPEQVLKAAPDVVLIRPFIRRAKPSFVAEIEKAGVTVVSLFPKSFDDFDDYIMELAIITGKKDEAKTKLAEFHNKLDELFANKPAKQYEVFFESTPSITTAAAGSMPARALKGLGIINVAGDAPSVSPGSSIADFGEENLLKFADQIDFYIVQQGVMDPTRSVSELQARGGFMSIDAIRQGRVLFINEDIISSPVFRYLEGVQAIKDYAASLDAK